VVVPNIWSIFYRMGIFWEYTTAGMTVPEWCQASRRLKTQSSLNMDTSQITWMIPRFGASRKRAKQF